MPTPYQQSIGGLMNPQGPQVGQGPITQAPPAMSQQGPQPGPPKDENDLRLRTDGWNAFFERLADPGVSKALIDAGAVMLSPRKYGESQGFKIAQGLSAGAESLNQTQQQDQQNQQENRRTAVTEKNAETNRMGTEANIRQGEAQLSLITEQINHYKALNDPAEREAKIKEINARTRLYEAQAGKAKADANNGGGSSASMSAESQQFITRRADKIARGMTEIQATQEAIAETYDKPKEFKMVTPEEFKADLRVKMLNTMAGIQNPAGIDDLIAKDVADYTSRYERERAGSQKPSTNTSTSSNDALTRYQSLLQQISNPSPEDAEKVRQAVVRAFGLPQNWNPQ